MNNINEIIYNAKIIKINEKIFIATFKEWFVKIFLNEEKQEYQLFYKGIHVTTKFTYNEKFECKSYITIKESIERNFYNE